MTFETWTENRVAILAQEEVTQAFMRGYEDYALGLEEDTEAFVGVPFAADDYHAGIELASYEVGPREKMLCDYTPY